MAREVLFSGEASVFALRSANTEWQTKGKGGTLQLWYNSKDHSDIGIDFKKDNVKYGWKVTPGKLKSKGEDAWVLRATDATNGSSEILAIRFSNDRNFHSFEIQYYSLIPPELQQQLLNSDEDKWKCSVCTFINDSHATVCRMCNMAQIRTLSMSQTGPNGGFNNMNDNNNNNNNYNNNNNNSNNNKNNNNNNGNGKLEQWVCDTCTYINPSNAMKCGFCDALKEKRNIRYSITQEQNDSAAKNRQQRQSVYEQQYKQVQQAQAQAAAQAKAQMKMGSIPEKNINDQSQNQNQNQNNNNNNNNDNNEVQAEGQDPQQQTGVVPKHKDSANGNPQWNCPVCTLINEAGTFQCHACGTQYLGSMSNDPNSNSVNMSSVPINQHLGLMASASNNNNNNNNNILQQQQQLLNGQNNAFWQESNLSVFSGDSGSKNGMGGKGNKHHSHAPSINGSVMTHNSHNINDKSDQLNKIASDICFLNAQPGDIFHTLRTVTKKLSKNDIKYRTLDTTNPKVTERLLGFEGVLDFLTILGFESDSLNYKLVCKEKPHPLMLAKAIEILTNYENQSKMPMLQSGANRLAPQMAQNALMQPVPQVSQDVVQQHRQSQQYQKQLQMSPQHGGTNGGVLPSYESMLRQQSDTNNGGNFNLGQPHVNAAQVQEWAQLQQEAQRQLGQNGQNGQNENDSNELTLNQIILWATYANSRDSDTMKTLIMTHKTFTDSLSLLRALRRRFWREPVPMDIREDEKKVKDFQNAVQKPIQLKVIKALRDWMKLYWESDFAGDTDDKIAIRREVQDWINFMINNEDMMLGGSWNKAIAERLIKEFERYCEKGGKFKKDPITNYNKIFEDDPTKEYPENFDGMSECTAKDIACQITLMDFEIFCHIEARECLGQAWKKKDKYEKAPNILRLIARFNQISTFIQYTILKSKGLRNRVKKLKKCIKIGEALRQLRNYNSLCAVWSGLNSTKIHRLKDAWGLLAHKQKVMFKQFGVIFLREHNSGNMRHLIRFATPPTIPHLGLLLQDLVFIEDGNKKTLEFDLPELPNKMVNFNKSVRVADRTKSITLFQQQGYDKIIPKENEILGKYLCDMFEICKQQTDDSLWKMSESCKVDDKKEADTGIF